MDIVRAFGRFLGTEELRARFDLVSPTGLCGATYANLFPGKVRALALDVIIDPIACSGC